MRMQIIRLAVSTFVFALMSCRLVAAAEFPDHPIRLIVSFPPGGYGDTVARLLADGLAAQSGATIIVDNQR
jgi:tripartite-type tricarboxylate transporter receptor subunit TctC